METVLKTKDVFQISLPTPFKVGPVNVYLIKGDRLTLVDAGPKLKETWEVLKQELSTIGYRPEEIEQVILTHHHTDHVGLLDLLPHASVYGHWRNEPWISQNEDFKQNQKQFFLQLLKENGVDPSLYHSVDKTQKMMFTYSCHAHLTDVLKEGDRIPGAEEWMVIETPGHAQSHISLYREKDGVMIAGDHIIKHISPNPVLEPPYKEGEGRAKPLLYYRDSVKKCKEMEISLLFSGHGEEIVDVDRLILHQLEMQEERAETVRQMIKEGEQTAYQICQKLFPQAYEEELLLTMSETIGQLDYLESIGEVYSEEEGTVRMYKSY